MDVKNGSGDNIPTGMFTEITNITKNLTAVTLETPDFLLLIAFFYLMSALISLANGSIFLLYLESKTVRKNFNAFLMSLITTETQLGAFFIPVSVVYSPYDIKRSRFLSESSCVFIFCWRKSVLFGAFWSVFLVSLDRLVAVRISSKYRQIMTTTRVAIIVILTWTGIVFTSVYPLLFPRSISEPQTDHQCNGAYVYSYAHVVYIHLANYIVPILFSTVFYLSMYCSLRKKRSTTVQSSSSSENSFSKLKSVAKTCLLASAIFAVGWAPYGLFRVLLASSQLLRFPLNISSTVTELILGLLMILGCIMSLINPIVHWVRCQALRDAVREWLTKIGVL